MGQIIIISTLDWMSAIKCDTNIESTDQPKGEMEYPEDDILFLSEVVLMKLSSKKLPIIGLIKSLQNFRRVLTTYWG